MNVGKPGTLRKSFPVNRASRRVTGNQGGERVDWQLLKDTTMTRTLHWYDYITLKVGQLPNIDVLDHLVIGRQRFVSLTERRLGFN